MPLPRAFRALVVIALGGALTLAPAAPALASDGDLLTADLPAVSVAPGGTADAAVTVGNATRRPVSMVKLRLTATRSRSFPATFANCRYGRVPGGNVAECLFDATLDPGAFYSLSAPITTSIATDAMAPGRLDLVYSWTKPGDPGYDTDHGADTPGTGPALSLVPLAEGAEKGDYYIGFARVDVIGNQRPDAVATETAVTGRAGTTVDVTLSGGNKGPAVIEGSNAHVGFARFTVPDGTTVTRVPQGCAANNPDGSGEAGPGEKVYHCSFDDVIEVKAAKSWTFGLRLDKPGTHTGTIRVVPEDGFHDTNPEPFEGDADTANDTAQVTVTVTAKDAAPDAAKPLAKTGTPLPLAAGIAGGLLLAGTAILAVLRRRGA